MASFTVWQPIVAAAAVSRRLLRRRCHIESRLREAGCSQDWLPYNGGPSHA
jgi:hypothetical protein